MRFLLVALRCFGGATSPWELASARYQIRPMTFTFPPPMLRAAKGGPMAEVSGGEDRMQTAIDALQAAHVADPRQHRYGMFISEDHQWGIGMFHWFESETALLHGLTRVMPVAMTTLDAADAEDLVNRLALTADGFPPSDRLGSACVAQLQVHLRKLACIDWVGSFESLCVSDAEWPVDLRKRFREDAAEVDAAATVTGSTPIGPDELEAFVEYISEYGY